MKRTQNCIISAFQFWLAFLTVQRTTVWGKQMPNKLSKSNYYRGLWSCPCASPDLARNEIKTWMQYEFICSQALSTVWTIHFLNLLFISGRKRQNFFLLNFGVSSEYFKCIYSKKSSAEEFSTKWFPLHTGSLFILNAVCTSLSSDGTSFFLKDSTFERFSARLYYRVCDAVNEMAQGANNSAAPDNFPLEKSGPSCFLLSNEENTGPFVLFFQWRVHGAIIFCLSWGKSLCWARTTPVTFHAHWHSLQCTNSILNHRLSILLLGSSLFVHVFFLLQLQFSSWWNPFFLCSDFVCSGLPGPSGPPAVVILAKRPSDNTRSKLRLTHSKLNFSEG